MKVQLDWQLKDGIASRGNFLLLLFVLLSFPIVLSRTGILSIATTDPLSPHHTPEFLKFCLVIAGFLWTCFVIALGGNPAPWQGRIS